MSSDEKIKTFSWNSIEDAKSEFYEAYSIICNAFRAKGVGYVMNPNEVVQRRGPMPEPLPVNANIALRTAHEARMAKHDEMKFKIDDDFGKAIAIIFKVFPYGSLVHSDLDRECNDAEFINNAQRYNACMNKLNSTYKPSNALNIDTLRRKIQNLDDSQGFDTYYQLFNRYVSELRSVNPTAVSDVELTEWVKIGIKNEKVFDATIGALVVHDNNNLNYTTIFNAIIRYLQAKRENNPYTDTTSATIRSDALVANTNQYQNNNSFQNRKRSFEQTQTSNKFCVRCGRTGHVREKCFAPYCSICRSAIDRWDKDCPNLSNHPTSTTNAMTADSNSTSNLIFAIDLSKSNKQLKQEANLFIKQARGNNPTSKK